MAHHCVVAAIVYQYKVGTVNSEKNSSNIADKQKQIATPMKYIKQTTISAVVAIAYRDWNSILKK
jgi:hypothetical protein